MSKITCRFLIALLCSQFAFASTIASLKIEPCAARLVQRQLLQTPTHLAPGKHARPLWPGSRFGELDRVRAISRGLRFIYRTALKRENFAEYGSDYLWCFYTLSNSVRDEETKQMARRMGVERAHAWRRLHRSLPPGADVDTILDYAFGSDAADSLNVRDEHLKTEIREAVPRFRPRDYLKFDPRTEPPPTDVPDQCEYDGAFSPRGSRLCHVCKRPLEMRTRYDVWYDALITTYSAERFGIDLGAHYLDVLKWLPSLRPWPTNEKGTKAEFSDAVYAVTHVVYTLNNYSQYRLSPALLPQEYEFLKSNLRAAIAGDDAVDMLGEMMDSLKSFGITSEQSDMRAAMEYYLSHQQRDGSWGRKNIKDIYDRYHPTWNAIAGLSEYKWKAGEGLSSPEVRPLLESWKHDPIGFAPRAPFKFALAK